MTDEEKFEMYMKIPHEELVKMKIEEERILEILDKQNEHVFYTDDIISIKSNEISVQYLYDEIQNLKKELSQLKKKCNFKK